MPPLLLRSMAPSLRRFLDIVHTWDKIEEIRLRVNQPLTIKEQHMEYGSIARCLPADGQLPGDGGRYHPHNGDDDQNSWYALKMKFGQVISHWPGTPS